MTGVIMAGGKGTRLSSLTKDEIPKPMMPVCGKPILQWQIDCMKKNGIIDILIIIGHLGEKITEYFGDGKNFGVSIRYIVEQTPLGTGGALGFLHKYIQNDYFLLSYGDTIYDIDLKRMEQFHVEKKSAATLFTHPNSHPFDSDIIVKDKTDKIIDFDFNTNNRNYVYENCVNAGLYILSLDLCKSIDTTRKLDLEKEFLLSLCKNKQSIYAYCSSEYIKDVGTPERIFSCEKDIQNGVVASKNLSLKQKCIFLDRDGTLNVFKGLIVNAQDIELEADAAAAVKLINQSSYLCAVVTNQPQVARGISTIENIENINKKLQAELGSHGAFLDTIEYCPHHPDKGYPEENPAYKIKCNCRKPKTGMLETIAQKFNIDLQASWIIGDTTTDIQAGKNVKMKTALVKTGEGGADKKFTVTPDLVERNLYEAIKTILQ